MTASGTMWTNRYGVAFRVATARCRPPAAHPCNGHTASHCKTLGQASHLFNGKNTSGGGMFDK